MHTSPLDAPGMGDAGGLNVYVAESAAALSRRGHRVEIFTRATDPADIGSVVLPSGVLVHRVIAGRSAPLRKNDLVDLVDEFGFSIDDFGAFDVVHSHYWLSGLAVLRSDWSCPHVHTFHTMARAKAAAVSSADAADSALRSEAEQLLCDEVAAVCCVSAADAASLQKWYRVADGRVAIVRPGVDPGLFRRRGYQARRQWRLLQRVPEKAIVVTMAGRVQPLKGQALFAEAISRIDPSLGVFGVVLGEPTPGHEKYFRALRERARQPDLAGRFAIYGSASRTDLAMWLAVSQVVAVPSATESFGMVSVEAQSAGVPVVARAVGGLPETLRDGVTGLLVPSADPDVWASTIAELAKDSHRRAVLGRAGHAFARERSWEAVAAELERVYASLDCQS